MSKLIRHIIKSAAAMTFMALLLASATLASASSLGSPIGAVTSGKLNLTVHNAMQAGLNGISGATVEVSTTAGDVIASGLTNGSGAFSSYVQEGIHTLRVSAPGYVQFSQTIKIAAGQSTNLQVSLMPAPVAAEGKLSVIVTSLSTSTLSAQPTVVVFDQAGTPVAKGTIGATGSFDIKLAQGSYKVLVQAAGFNSDTQKVEIVAGKLTEVKVLLTPIAPSVTAAY